MYVAALVACRCLIPPLTLVAITVVTGSRNMTTADSSAAQPLIFLAVGLCALGFGDIRGQVFRFGKTIVHLLGAALVIFVVVAVAYEDGLVRPRAFWTAAVLGAAYVEEVVFRVLLPSRIERDFTAASTTTPASQWGGVILAQMTFAVSHIAPRLSDGLVVQWVDLVRLSTSGLCLWAIFVRAGLWLAVSLHAFVNIALLAPPPAVFSGANAQLGLWLIGSVALWSTAPISRLSISATRRKVGVRKKARVSA